MKNLTTMLAALLFCMIGYAQTWNYVASNENIANPERGFYHYRLGKSSNFTPLTLSDLNAMRSNEKITLVWRCYQLDAFMSSPITQDFLSKIQTDFNTMRLAGLKCVLRFSYKENNSSAPFEPEKALIIAHIDQLKEVTRLNQDVISSIEAGFIGKYGEWYYSTHFGQDNLTAQNYADRLQVAEKIMELAPLRMVAFRYVDAIRRLFGNAPISPANAYNGSNKSRAASHNDCFLGNATDYGTYINPSVEYPYLEQQTLYTFDGGETCNCSTTCSNDPYVNQTNALFTMRRFHFNYLNIDYNTTVLNYWNGIGFLDVVKRNLGYRYELANTTVTATSVTVTLTNTGFGNIFNARDAYLVLRNSVTGAEYSFPFDTDPRKWPINEPVQLSMPLDLPIPVGNYRLFLNLPEKQIETLVERQALTINPNYSIRCANVGTWEATTGYNDLQATANVRNLGVDVFVKDGQIQVRGLKDYSIRIFDLTGKMVGNSLDVSGLSHGVYMVKVNQSTYKIVR